MKISKEKAIESIQNCADAYDEQKCRNKPNTVFSKTTKAEFAYILKTDKGFDVIFRGTDLTVTKKNGKKRFTILGWLRNIKIWPVKEGIPGGFYKGYKALCSIEKELIVLIENFYDFHGYKPEVNISGHSRGCPEAWLLCKSLHRFCTKAKFRCTLFSPPNFLKKNLLKSLATLSIECIWVEGDIVTKIPWFFKKPGRHTILTFPGKKKWFSSGFIAHSPITVKKALRRL